MLHTSMYCVLSRVYNRKRAESVALVLLYCVCDRDWHCMCVSVHVCMRAFMCVCAYMYIIILQSTLY